MAKYFPGSLDKIEFNRRALQVQSTVNIFSITLYLYCLLLFTFRDADFLLNQIMSYDTVLCKTKKKRLLILFGFAVDVHIEVFSV